MTTISNHPRLNPTKQRLIAGFVRIILGISLILNIGLLIVAIIYILPLLLMTVILLTLLTLPLFMATSFNPTIEVREDGILVTPLVWRSRFIEWSQISHLTAHPMLKPAPPSQIPFIKKTPQDGLLIVCSKTTAGWHYRIVGVMTGYGRTPVFAISNHTHADYKQLHHELKRYLEYKDAQ